MKKYAPGIESDDLSLITVSAIIDDEPGASAGAPSGGAEPARHSPPDAARVPTLTLVSQPVVDAAPPPAAEPLSPPNMGPARAPAEEPDKYSRRALKEHCAGHVDRTLWARAMAQAGGDKGQARNIYIQSRATALRVTQRELKAARYANVVEALSNTPDPGLESSAARALTDKAPPHPLGAKKARRKRAIVIGGAIASVALVGGVAAALLWESEPPTQYNITGPVAARAAPAIAAGKAAPGAASAAEPPRADLSGEDFVSRMQALEQAGNWNLVVLYGGEWTRKQPANPEAWKKLTQGYIKLRQYREALEAATEATQLAPEDFAAWRNLGQVNVELQVPTEALAAYHHAAVLNEHDGVSLVQEGKMNAQLGRLPDAKAAYSKALALNADDVQALCGSVSIAQREGHPKDAEALTRQVASLSSRCLDSSVGESVRIVTNTAVGQRTAP